MNTRNQMLCAWAGPAFMLSFLVGIFFVAQYVPPHAPTADAATVAAFYQHAPTRIRLGLLITMFSATLWIPWAAVIAMQMKRIEGDFPVLAYTQLATGTATAVIVIIPIMVWTAAAFRPERNPELLLLFNDLGFIFFVMLVAPSFIEILAIGIAILSDESGKSVFPRWAGFFNLWVALLTLPGGLVTFFKTGPFAWNGILAFWLPLTVFGIWYGVMFMLLRKAILGQVVVPPMPGPALSNVAA